MTNPVVVRFAPSPTGPPHLGSRSTALYDWLLARATGGRFILRIDDTDQNRYTPQAEEQVIEALPGRAESLRRVDQALQSLL